MVHLRAPIPILALSGVVLGGAALVSTGCASSEYASGDSAESSGASATTSGSSGTSSTGTTSAGATTTSTGAPADTSTSEPGAPSTGAPADTSTGEPGTSSTSAPADTTSAADTTGAGTTGGIDTTSGTTDTSGTTGALEPPEATTLQLDFSPIKQFEFTWPAAPGATYYQLLERPTPADDYQQLGADIADLSITLTMPLHLRLGASYIVSACNAGGCTDSAPVEVVDSLATAVGYVKASNTDAGDRFGAFVALSADGTTLAVGAQGEASAATGVGGDQTSNTAATSGAVYVFVHQDGAWSQQAYLKASNAQYLDNFGIGVVLSADGDTLAVAAPGEDSTATGIDGDQASNNASNAGAVYVFTRSGAVWSQQAYVKASNTGAGDNFGTELALSSDGDTLAIGAYGEASAAAGIDGDQSSNVLLNAGAVYVFTRSGGAWSQQAYVKASNPGYNDQFGRAVALSGDGDTLAVTASLEDSAATGIGGDQANDLMADSGAVYVFTRSGGAWSQQAYVKASNTGAGDWFGYSLALSGNGDTLAVGAYREDSAATGVGGDEASDAASESGAAYVFTRTAAVWSQQSYLKASNTGASDWFGYGLALSADGATLAISATREDSAATGVGGDQADNSVLDPGAVYVFTYKNAAWSQRAYLKAPNPDASDNFGFGLALAADGRTLAVGTPNEDSAATGIGGDQASNAALTAGAIYLY